MTTKIAILGAGNVGGNFGIRLARSGYSIRFGVRDAGKVAEIVTRCEGRAEAASVQDAVAWADVIVVALPHTNAVEVVRQAGSLAGKVIIDTTNPVGWNDGPVLAPVPEGSIAAALAKAAPGAHVVKAFNTFGAEFHLEPKLAGTSVDVQIAGDDADAKKLVAEIASKAGFTPVDAGPLRNAALLENLAILWIHLALKGSLGRHIAFKLLRKE